MVGDLADALLAEGEFEFWVQISSRVEIVSAPVALIGQVGFLVVFEAVDGAVVVHIDAVEELRPVGVKAQKRFFVVGKAVGALGTVVLVVVGDKVVVLVPAWKDYRVAR